ncbi:polyphosphate kinase 2 [Aquiflexum sp. TKW24L]|uniref:polyphosphate kinase 2 n=1 Tax=Aquiflexum sp. TKW24L TaxID=2942212 RepID=UPI0020C16331|nr:polyphosphate kinase 2 [Aquiflexum sp. TKW24L]MCL6258998.1 polyphosphate kinase 2 [Aquiflexum sp. TKW24L]
MFSAEQLENIKTRKELVALSKIEGINLKKSIKRAKYEEDLKLLQTELALLQEHIEKKNLRVAVIFEGRDAAGKGGSIKRFVEFLNPNSTGVVALSKPTDVERGQWYFQRYIEELPNSGQIKFFDRSWYNRAVVEPVMGFCSEKQYETFMKQVPNFEHMLYEDGIIVIKFWFDISRDEQQKRFDARLGNPLKEWKFSPVDLKGQELWDELTEYKEMMFTETHTSYCPWVIVETNDKEEARLESLRYVLSRFKYPRKGKTKANLKNDPNVIFKYFRKNQKFDL